jgi:hypothetical protein
VLDEEADLVHVGREHHPRSVPALDPDDVAEGVDPDFVDQRPQLVDDEVAHEVLAAGDAGRLAEALEQIDVGHVHVVPSPRIAGQPVAATAPSRREAPRAAATGPANDCTADTESGRGC